MMETLNLFEGWTSGMVRTLVETTKDGRGNPGVPQSEDHRRKISKARISLEAQNFRNRKLSDLYKEWSPELVGLLKDQRGKGGRTGKTNSAEHRRKISQALTGLVRGPNSKEHNRRVSEALTGRINGPPSEETRRRMSRAQVGRPRRPATEEEKRINSEARRAYWANLTPEEKVDWMRRSLLSDEAIKKNIETRKVRPNRIEGIVDRYLQRTYPDEWKYNGDFSQGISIGRRIPDFVNINGRKEVISVMGGLGFCHFLEDEKKEIEHYAGYGYKCTIIWEWDVWDPEELGKVLVFKGGK